ncbi:serine/threonine-protein kinase CTR1-like isoform X1 [Solanum pennellii]|uniref:Serine/threonine-protein kinase CTR1-like isoform X1 n=1 Tax=Solanum pennellii TaxID=28526 RepID=A0ABM1HQD1_SOLPN|nr:serine/threonine-protein kinase CTR1-like isoform X1 [Solanum pennellii]
MEVPVRRSNYAILQQQPPYDEFNSDEKSKSRGDKGLYWDLIDRRKGTTPFQASIVLPTPSSEGSFAESSISGVSFGHMNANSGGGGSLSKSWAQQTEESYQLQLTLALRISTEATCADDPNLLDYVPDESVSHASASSASVEAMSHRFWVNGSLSYFDKVPDGFYFIQGMDPYIWTVCSDLQESGRIPSIESLKAVDPSVVPSVEVILIDRQSDPRLKELQNRIHSMYRSCNTTKEVVDQLAKLVCNHMGGAASVGEGDFIPIWKECSNDLKDCLGCFVFPIGSLSVGLCRHRTLLFKVLADIIDLPCRIARGCKYCKESDAFSCLVRFGLDREYLVDLIRDPGCLYEPNSLLNGPSSISIPSPLRLPRFGQVEPAMDFTSFAKQYFSDCLSLNLAFDDSSAGTAVDGDAGQTDRSSMDKSSAVSSSSNRDEVSRLPLPPINAWNKGCDKGSQLPALYHPSNMSISMSQEKDLIHLKNVPPIRNVDAHLIAISEARTDTINDQRYFEGVGRLAPAKPSRGLVLDVEDLDIPWNDLVLKERIGAGSFGTVHRADWNGSDVAVKILMEQDFHAERYKEFLQEVAIMKRLRHPNIVLFMGAVTEPPNLSIVTEYLSRGSLYRLLHKPGAREVLDERRRLCMAYDVAKGMNYLHKRKPPVVHRDLKSPNLLVDKKYTVKVCDFGLSRLKANTFLSSKSAAGTPEWMAPEVLRDEPSNEKSDIYSFGVILWELATLQQPWSNLNPPQVVAAVGFKGMRLEIPRDLNHPVTTIIEACWVNEPWKRPSFSTIMDMLKSLI